MPAVSVIVAAYNVEDYIGRCLKRLTAQTLASIEIIVINDGSTDGTQSVIEEYAVRFPQTVRAITKPNGGLSDARNLGIDQARGDYIAFMDGDDYPKVDMYEELYRRACETGSDIVVCGYVAVDMRDGSRTYSRQGWPSQYGGPLTDNPQLLGIIAPYAWNKLFRRSLFTRTGIRFPVGLLFEDIPVTYALLAEANTISKVQRGLYNYIRFREGAITHSYSPRNLEMFDSLALLNEYYIEKGLFDELRDELLELNFRHSYNRFAEMPLYTGRATKLELVLRIEDHMGQYFPRWWSSPLLFGKHQKKWRFWAMRWRWSRRQYARIPRWFHSVADATTAFHEKTVLKARGFFRRIGPRYRLSGYVRDLRRPVAANVALFESFSGSNATDSPFYLMRDFVSRGSCRAYVATRDVAATRRYLALHDLDATPVKMHSRLYCRLLATAGYIVNNVSMPPYFVKRSQQIYLNTWHGTPLKTLGKAMPTGLADMPNIQRSFLKADAILFTNEYTREHMSRDYCLAGVYAGVSLLMGSPRNEALLDSDAAARVRSELGVEGKSVSVYMPTWRGGSSRSVQLQEYLALTANHLMALDSMMSADQVMYVKFHSLVSQSIEFGTYQHIRPFPDRYETYEFLAAADVLVTDYSSVFFDFSVTGKQIVLFAHDLDEYLAERNLYTDYEALPFPIARTVEELADHLARTGEHHVDQGYAAFSNRFVSLDHIGAAAELNDALIRMASERRASPADDDAPEVDVVFLPYLKRKGQKKLKGLLAEGYARDDVLFVFSIKKERAKANAFLYDLCVEQDVQLNYAVSSGRMSLTISQTLALWMYRRWGLAQRAFDEAYLVEWRRLLGDTRVRSARDVSGYRKFKEMTQVMNRHLAAEQNRSQR